MSEQAQVSATEISEEEYRQMVADRKAKQSRRESGEPVEQGKGYVPFKWLNLALGVETVFRLIGRPAEFRQTPFDPKVLRVSKLLNEKGYMFPVVWSTYTRSRDGKVVHSKEFPLAKLGNAVFEREEGDNSKFKHVDTAIYKILKNNKPESWDTPVSFWPSPAVVANVISRMDNWCESNGHTMMLSRKVTEKNGKQYAETGVSETLYEDILKKVFDFHGHWDLDLIIKKESNPLDKKDVTYEMRDATETARLQPATKKLIKQVPKLIEIDDQTVAERIPLSDAEKQYKLFNLDTIFAPTPASKILEHFGFLFSKCDEELGTSLLQELVEQANAEKTATPVSGARVTSTPVSSAAESSLHDEATDDSAGGEPDEETPF